MGSDLVALNALARELNARLTGARIDKIQQPETDELRFLLRSQGKNLCLAVSCNAQAPRIHLTDFKKPVPKTAPNLCMLLRKYLSNASVAEVGVYNADRILFVRFNAKTEMKDDAVFFLFAEIMNRYSNIVFTDSDLRILDAVKHLPLDIARDHIVMRGVIYAPVAQSKISYLNDCDHIFDNFTGGDLRKYIQSNISGLSGASVSELLFRAGLDDMTYDFGEDAKRRLLKGLEFFRNFSPSPCIIDKEVYPFVYSSLAAPDMSNVVRFDSMSEAYDALYTGLDRDIRNRSRLKSLVAQAKRLRARAEKNIAQDLDRLRECENMEVYRVFGELVVNNIYLIRKGDVVLKCFDYYSEKEVEIPLDPQLSPSKNSSAYYAKYAKLKRTKQFTEKKLEQDKLLLSYIISIEEELAALPYDAPTFPIEEELASLGGVKKTSKDKVRKPAQDPPYEWLVDGFYIYRGKNNLQNEELTFKIASSNDMWLHLKAEHGAHTVIIAEGRDIPEKVLKIAAEITAATKQAPCDVDYTQRRNVRRQPGGHPGMVIYTNYKTMLVSPDMHEEFLIKR